MYRSPGMPRAEARGIYATVSTPDHCNECDLPRGDNGLETASNGPAEDLIFASNYNTMTDNKYQSQMSKAIDVAQLKSGAAHAAGVHPSELPNIIPYLQACSEENILVAWLSTTSLINLTMLEHTELQFSTCN